MYTKDLTSLLQLLKVSEQSMVLHIEPPEITGEAWYARLTLVGGDVTMCQILRVGDEALLINGPRALRWLTTLGRLSYEEQKQSPSRLVQQLLPPPQRQPPVSHNVEQLNAKAMPPFIRAVQESRHVGKPQRTARGEREGVAVITGREHRLVFLLVDGFHTPEEIASLLHKSPERIRQVLADLYHQDLIK
ncbi:MAG: hypothetical protein NVS4B11_13060 [Ktedonobacteraceae bacterium]